MLKGVENRLMALNRKRQEAANCDNCQCPKATKSGKFIAAFYRFLPLRFCPSALPATDVRGWCLSANQVIKVSTAAAFPARPQRSQSVVDCPWLRSLPSSGLDMELPCLRAKMARLFSLLELRTAFLESLAFGQQLVTMTQTHAKQG
jgi:hypothetical protein